MKVLTLALIAISIVGCDNKPFGIGQPTEEEKLQAVVRVSLKDPDSAKFGQVTVVKESNACVAVNAKNSLGGYTGEQQAFLVKTNGLWQVISIDQMAHERCIEVMSQVH